MYYIMLNGEFTLDAEGLRISYASREDALAARSYFDLKEDDVCSVMHYLEAMEYEALLKELLAKQQTEEV